MPTHSILQHTCTQPEFDEGQQFACRCSHKISFKKANELIRIGAARWKLGQNANARTFQDRSAIVLMDAPRWPSGRKLLGVGAIERVSFLRKRERPDLWQYGTLNNEILAGIDGENGKPFPEKDKKTLSLRKREELSPLFDKELLLLPVGECVVPNFGNLKTGDLIGPWSPERKVPAYASCRNPECGFRVLEPLDWPRLRPWQKKGKKRYASFDCPECGLIDAFPDILGIQGRGRPRFEHVEF